MATRRLGRNGPVVSAVGLGLMGVSAAYPPALTEEETAALLDAAVARGCTFWDSSDVYGDNSERLRAYFEKSGNRDKVFLCSKIGITFPGGVFSARTDPEYIHSATNTLLGRLGLPFLDMLYLHRVNTEVPIERSIRALVELKNEGKIGHIGLSECSASTLRRAHAVHPIAAVQIEYSPFELTAEENGLIDACRELGVAVVAYSPIGRGLLTGQLRSRADFQEGDFRLVLPRFSEENFPKNVELVDKFEQLAKARGVTVAQFALAWVLAQGPEFIPIPGTTKASRVDENMRALEISVTKEEDKQIRDILSTITLTGERYPEALSGSLLYADTVPEN